VWETWFWIGAGVLVLTLATGIILRRIRKIKGIVHFRYYLFAGVLLSAVALMIPFITISINGIGPVRDSCLHIVVSAVRNALQMFSLDAEYTGLIGVPETLSPFWMPAAYTYLLSAEFLLAPLLMFTIVMMFFRNITASFSYKCHLWSNVHVFSELNEESLALAKSIKNGHKWNHCIVFTDVPDDMEEEATRLIKEAKDLRAICFRKDILGPNFMIHLPWVWLKFYVIGKDEVKNIEQSAELMERYTKKRKCFLYIFTSRPECGYLLDTRAAKEKKKKDRVEVRRINAVSSLVSRTLYEDGYQLLYQTASGTGYKKKISVVLVGLGQHGMEMLKALTWYCRMYGYEVEINAFDKDKNARKRVLAACPELFKEKDAWAELSERMRDFCREYLELKQGGEPDTKKTEEGEEYNIHIHPDLDTESIEFVKILDTIDDPTYVLVALGDDEKNIRTAVDLRTLFEQKGKAPKIQAIVYNSNECRILKDLKNFKKQAYNIDFIGDVDSSYTESVLINSDLEKAGRAVHMDYNQAEIQQFYDFEYNYRSSCASAIHSRAVAWHLLDAELDRTLLEKMEFWLKLIYQLSQKNEKPNKLQNAVGEEMVSWAKQMAKYLDEQAERQPFTFKEWKYLPKSQEKLEQLRKIAERLTKENKQEPGSRIQGLINVTEQITDHLTKDLQDYGRWLQGYSEKEKEESDKDFELEQEAPYTRAAILDSVINIDKSNVQEGRPGPWEPEKAAAYFLLAVKLMKLEHDRWMAYMRTEGYRYAEKRNDLGKTHYDLRPFTALQNKEKAKDLHVKILCDQQEWAKNKKEMEKAKQRAGQ
jgi:hypothetical protein